MSENPYAPPEARVDDPDSGRPRVKPPQVVLAVRLFWGSLALGVVNSAIQWQDFTAQMSAGAVIGIQAVTLAIVGFLTVMMSAGRNWARIVTLVLFAIGVPGYFVSLADTFSRSPVAGLISVAQIVMQVVALYLVFFRPGSEWYRK